MKAKLKIILATVACTTIAWVVVLVCFFWFALSRGPDAAMIRFPAPGRSDSLELEIQRGEYVVEVVSSNVTTFNSSLLFSRTSRPPERVWFAVREVKGRN